jgi:hypothetical protein
MLAVSMKNGVIFIVFLALAAFFGGCATTPKGILITTRSNPDFSPTRTDAICMSLQNHPSKEDTALGSALMAELANEHFNIITNADARYTLVYLVEDDSTAFISEHDETDPVLAPPPQNNAQMVSSGMFGQPYNPGGMYSSPGGLYKTTDVTTPLVFTDKGIRLYLYARPKGQSGGLQLAWEGYIGGGRTVTPERIQFLIKTLLGYFGQDYTGRIDLTDSVSSASLTH